MKKNQHGFGLLAVIIVFVVLAGIAVTGWLVFKQNNGKNEDGSNSGTSSSATSITNFDECVAAGNPVMESSPEQCRADGQTFTKQAGTSTQGTSGSSQPGTETISGKIICLPKPGNGPQTLECAIGLQTADQKNYALKDNPEYDLPVNTQVTVTGTVTPAGNDEMYVIIGTIDVDKIEKAD